MHKHTLIIMHIENTILQNVVDDSGNNLKHIESMPSPFDDQEQQLYPIPLIYTIRKHCTVAQLPRKTTFISFQSEVLVESLYLL